MEVSADASVRSPHRFAVDAAFGAVASTADVFTSVRDLAHKTAAGQSAAVIAYGPTGSGKTHTMFGTAQNPGLVPRLVAELLSLAKGKRLRVSVLELHNDMLSDLLAPRGARAQALDIRGGSGGSMAMVEGAQEVCAEDPRQLLAVIQLGIARRQVASTAANKASSRSHLILELSMGEGRLTLVDLAGLERVKRTGSEGGVLREAQCINRSLQSLGDVVEALRRKAGHVPFRNSCLARILGGALGGGVETAVLVCVSPSWRDEAVTALCFAERVRRIPAAAVATRSAKQRVGSGSPYGPRGSSPQRCELANFVCRAEPSYYGSCTAR